MSEHLINLAIQVLGMAGAVLLLYAYYRVSRGDLSAQKMPYHFINLTGAMLLAVNTAWFGAWGAMVLNVVWVAISLRYLISQKWWR